MTRSRTEHRHSAPGRLFTRTCSVAALLALLGGCSSTPDWANPVEWYRGASDAVFGSDEAESETAKPAASAQKTPGADRDFPNLASVPERPRAPTEAERDQMARSLAADRANARYSDEQIERQTDSVTPPPAPPPPAAVASPAPTPPSATPRPVTRAEIARPVPPVQSARTQAPAPVPAAPPVPARTAPAPQMAATSAAPLPPIQNRPPQFAPAPARAQVPTAEQDRRTVRSLVTRPSPSARSIARIGNPTFGAPPADIAQTLGAGTPPAFAGSVGPGAVTPFPQPSGTLAARAAVAGERVALIRFPVGSARLSARDRGLVRQIAQAYKQRGGAIRVEGHASSRTKDMNPVQHQLVNFDISLSRANAVASELIRQGVPAEAVFVSAMSDSQPIYYEVMPAGEDGNRRAEIFFVN